jgi:hypothetical protein
MRLKYLRGELHWYQMMVRLDIKALKRSKEAVNRIAKEMRKVQNGK